MSTFKYKYWIYYVNPDILEDLACVINEDNCIYAYTDDKDVAEQFEKIHDMTKFIKKKVSLTRSEVNILAKTERNQYMKLRKIITKNDSGEPIYVVLAITMQEEKLLDLQILSSLNNLVYKVCVDPFPIRIFKEDIIEDLSSIRYFSISNNSVIGKNILNISNSCIEIIGEERMPKIYADEISIYTNLFHQILSKE